MKTGLNVDVIEAGFPVASAGDVNGDGIDDIIIGASYTPSGMDNAVGTSYVVFGSTDIGSTAIFAIWYPLLPANRHEYLIKALTRNHLNKVLLSGE
ncbi:MAG: hypothetical protein COB51_09845 [Moraxellaceae bacterium]|nr:MAG: hypothetical protein COB51_09845 [Moraxellaceae bacterium]